MNLRIFPGAYRDKPIAVSALNTPYNYVHNRTSSDFPSLASPTPQPFITLPSLPSKTALAISQGQAVGRV